MNPSSDGISVDPGGSAADVMSEKTGWVWMKTATTFCPDRSQYLERDQREVTMENARYILRRESQNQDC